MTPRSTITRLPPELRSKIDRLLMDGRFTLDEIMARLDDLEAGVSRSAVGRYAKSKEKLIDSMRRSADLAATAGAELGDQAATKAGRVLIELTQAMMFDLVLARADMDDDEAAKAMDTKKFAEFARAQKDLMSAAKTSVELDIKIREDQEKRTKAAAVEATEKVAKERGLTADTIEAIKSSILGVKTT